MRHGRLLLTIALLIAAVVACAGPTGGGGGAPAAPTCGRGAPSTAPVGTPSFTTDRAGVTSAASASPSPGATETAARVYGCPSGACPRSLQYAVNGCTCAGKVFDESSVSAAYCCNGGFSDSPCPESLAAEAALTSVFGSTQAEVEGQLVTLELKGWPIHIHTKAEAAFRRVAARLERIDYEIREPIGSQNWRVVAGHSVKSTHSFGVAVDINPGANPSCGVTKWCRCLNELITDMPPEFVQAFKDEGFEWGGDWADHPDPMHFEWVGWR